MQAFSIQCSRFDKKALRRDGRVVDCTGLENRQDESPPEFESLFLRHLKYIKIENVELGIEGKSLNYRFYIFSYSGGLLKWLKRRVC